MRQQLLSVVIALGLVLTGCGYAFPGSTSILPEDVKSVAIARVQNDTIEPGLGIELAEALRSSFERYEVVDVVDNEEQADAVLRTTITNVNTRVKSVEGSTDIALDYEMTMVVSGELVTRDGRILWRNTALRERGSFASTEDVVVTTSSNFATGGISAGTLGGLESREISRGQQRETLVALTENISRKLYLEAVAADF